jgi:hypothetical protein
MCLCEPPSQHATLAGLGMAYPVLAAAAKAAEAAAAEFIATRGPAAARAARRLRPLRLLPPEPLLTENGARGW